MKPFDLDIPRMGYILCYKNTGSWITKQIVKAQFKKGFTKREAEVSHVEISGGGPDSIEIAPPRSKLIKINKKHKGRYLYILRPTIEDYDYHGRYKVAYFSATQNNTGYDIPGVLKFIAKWIKQSNRLLFCSEGALKAIHKQYPSYMPMKPEESMPAHFMREFECIWEGIIT
jgi:hypothetical protein